MPRYIDRHDLTDQVTAEGVAAAHLKDLEAQEKYGVRYLNYWLDYGGRRNARLKFNAASPIRPRTFSSP